MECVSVTCVVHVSIGGSVPRAQVGGAGIAVLWFRRVDTKAPYLTICTIHHLHKLPTPKGQQQKSLSHSLQTCQSIQMSVKQISVIHYAYWLTLSAQQFIKLSACHSTVIHHREKEESALSASFPHILALFPQQHLTSDDIQQCN